jgi:uncharacterized protein YndB with AHSA1/START domain
VPTARRSRTIQAPTGDLWALVSDPHHLPRWWPRVTRVEGVEGDAFTEVLMSAKGKIVRADFTILEIDRQSCRLLLSQQLQGTPFERLLSRAETEVKLEPEGTATNVTIELRQSLTGVFPRFGGYMVKRAAAATLKDALDGLERISG